MTQWRVEVTSVTSDTLTEDQRETLALALPGYAIIADDESTRSIIAAFDVEARTQRDAAAAAAKTVTRVARDVLGEALPFLGVRVAKGDKTPQASAPELVGYIEIATILGVSRQRARQLAEDHADFPAPVARLAMGPVFTLDSVMEFAKGWERRSGRPSKASA